jgi:transcriptional activator SPT8
MSVVALRPLKAPVMGGLTSFGQSTAPFDSLAFPTETIDAPDWMPSNGIHSPKAETAAPTSALNEPSQSIAADDAKSDTSYDPLFDAEPDAELDNQMTGADSRSIQPKADPNSRVNSQSDLSGSGGKLEGVPFAQGTRAFDQTLASSFSYDIVLTAAIDGQLLLWDRRSAYKHVGRLPLLDKCPPWCVSVGV